MSKISEKQKLLTQLEKQLLALQEEISELQDSNPLYKETWNKLKSEKESLQVLLNKSNMFVFQDFVEIHYKWGGIDEYPEVISYKFFCNDLVSLFLEKTIIGYQTLDQIFDIEEEQIIKAKKNLDVLDQKVKTFNNKVKKAFKEFQEEQLNELLF
jgi:hypothetical protein